MSQKIFVTAFVMLTVLLTFVCAGHMECFHILDSIFMILENKLSAKNEITATGALAIPAVRYSFDIINCRLKEIRKIDRKTIQILTMHTMHHPKADTDRRYVKRKGGEKACYKLK